MVSGNFLCPVSGSTGEASPVIIELALDREREREKSPEIYNGVR